MHPVWLLMRRAAVPVEVGGIELAPGDEVFFSPYALRRDSSPYPEPDRFDPDRWLKDRCGVPFGAGNRLCVGERFAWTEMTIVVATIVARWRLAPAPQHGRATGANAPGAARAPGAFTAAGTTTSAATAAASRARL